MKRRPQADERHSKAPGEDLEAYDKIQPVNPNAVYLQAEGALDRIAVTDVLTAIERIHERGSTKDAQRQKLRQF